MTGVDRGGIYRLEAAGAGAECVVMLTSATWARVLGDCVVVPAYRREEKPEHDVLQPAPAPLAQQAQLDKAYTQYKAGEQAQALATIERFLRLHPASPALDYALYLKGLVTFNENLGLLGSLVQQDLSERDQKAAKESFEALREVATRFPESRYAADARARMTYIVNSLAQSEVHVARYYMSRGAYLAAINRAQTALSDYPTAPALEEALAILVGSYDALGMTRLRDDARRVLQASYPNSSFLGKAGADSSKPWWKLW